MIQILLIHLQGLSSLTCKQEDPFNTYLHSDKNLVYRFSLPAWLGRRYCAYSPIEGGGRLASTVELITN